MQVLPTVSRHLSISRESGRVPRHNAQTVSADHSNGPRAPLLVGASFAQHEAIGFLAPEEMVGRIQRHLGPVGGLAHLGVLSGLAGQRHGAPRLSDKVGRGGDRLDVMFPV